MKRLLLIVLVIALLTGACKISGGVDQDLNIGKCYDYTPFLTFVIKVEIPCTGDFNVPGEPNKGP